jgi:hypothetical protein
VVKAESGRGQRERRSGGRRRKGKEAKVEVVEG